MTSAPLTPDGHHRVIAGRRWRATDPAIPEPLRVELVRELMAARRQVGAADDPDATAAARRRVQDAKVALGERGEPWWEEPTDEGRRSRIESAMRALLRARADTSSICPSDVARVIGGTSWRSVMDDVRAAAAHEQEAGTVRVTQGDDDVIVDDAVGPIRLRRGAEFPDPPP